MTLRTFVLPTLVSAKRGRMRKERVGWTWVPREIEIPDHEPEHSYEIVRYADRMSVAAGTYWNPHDGSQLFWLSAHTVPGSEVVGHRTALVPKPFLGGVATHAHPPERLDPAVDAMLRGIDPYALDQRAFHRAVTGPSDPKLVRPWLYEVPPRDDALLRPLDPTFDEALADHVSRSMAVVGGRLARACLSPVFVLTLVSHGVGRTLDVRLSGTRSPWRTDPAMEVVVLPLAARDWLADELERATGPGGPMEGATIQRTPRGIVPEGVMAIPDHGDPLERWPTGRTSHAIMSGRASGAVVAGADSQEVPSSAADRARVGASATRPVSDTPLNDWFDAMVDRHAAPLPPVAELDALDAPSF